MLYSSPEAFLGHVLDTVRPYLDRLVLIGGCAVRRYEHHPRAMPMATQILRHAGHQRTSTAHVWTSGTYPRVGEKNNCSPIP